jgi:hypothetical protein
MGGRQGQTGRKRNRLALARQPARFSALSALSQRKNALPGDSGSEVQVASSLLWLVSHILGRVIPHSTSEVDDTTCLLQPTFAPCHLAWQRQSYAHRQTDLQVESSGELARAGGRRHNEHDVFVDKWAVRLEATICDDGYTHQHTAFQRTTAQWTRWPVGRPVWRWEISSCRPWHQWL